METRKAYPTDVSGEEWAFVVPYLSLMTPDALQRDYELREVFNPTRGIVRTLLPSIACSLFSLLHSARQAEHCLANSSHVLAAPDEGSRGGSQRAPGAPFRIRHAPA
jgi:hypothetical protein